MHGRSTIACTSCPTKARTESAPTPRIGTVFLHGTCGIRSPRATSSSACVANSHRLFRTSQANSLGAFRVLHRRARIAREAKASRPASPRVARPRSHACSWRSANRSPHSRSADWIARMFGGGSFGVRFNTRGGFWFFRFRRRFLFPLAGDKPLVESTTTGVTVVGSGPPLTSHISDIHGLLLAEGSWASHPLDTSSARARFTLRSSMPVRSATNAEEHRPRQEHASLRR